MLELVQSDMIEELNAITSSTSSASISDLNMSPSSNKTMSNGETLDLYIAEQHTNCAQVRIYSGGVNVITGKSRKDEEETVETNIREKRPVEQDYMVVGPKKQCGATQLWLDGFVLADGTIRQFVAVAPQSGHSVESQLTGVDEVGGIQIEVAPRFLPKSTFELFIKTLNGRSIPLSFDADSPSNISIHEIKARLAQIEGIPMEKQRLIYGGKQLEDRQ